MDLSLLIPARNEMFLARTIEDILTNIRGDTEIIAVLDGQWPDPPIADNPRVHLIYYPESIGQRVATNRAAAMATGRYVMKVDAHCAFDEGFDVKLLADMQDDWTVVPIMRNLHAFDWLCADCGKRIYQGPTPDACPECGGAMSMDVVWIAKPSPQSKAYCFDPEPHFQYFREFSKRPEGKGDLTETMSLQGSCFMMTRERYFALNVCDETWGSWGSQGIEVAVKTWLSGGRVMVNHKTWYAHLFRTQGGDFSFPYPLTGKQTDHAKSKARDLLYSEGFPQQVRPLQWLLDKFKPVPGWDVNKGIIYYTDNLLDETIAESCRRQLLKAGLPINSASLQPLDFGENVIIDEKRGILTMFKQ
ncbi:MAG: glycosyltransferase, partial [Gammaproteobacteria bacterium]|nr:glycosyltransferase [Gammaproteobacteria bacterium]